MLLPLLLICGAAVSAAIVAYGTSSELAQFAHGIQIILLSRRLEWPMVALSLVLCATLLAITISGRRSVWWLLGLSPVLALFVRGFSSTYHPSITLLESPQFVVADQNQTSSLENEYVVGLLFDGNAYALPYHALAHSPLVLISAFDKRALVIWSMTANCAMVLPLDRDTRPREIDVVSRPADSLLLFDTRLGQFIVGVTGQTVGGGKPVCFGSPIAVDKIPFRRWVHLHPDTVVLQSTSREISSIVSPVLPLLRCRQVRGGPDGASPIAMLATTRPTAVLSNIASDHPLNTQAGETRVLLERDPQTQTLRAFDRHLKEDLFLTLNPVSRPVRKHPEIALVDSESESHWTADGRAIEGPLKGDRLHEIAVDDGLYWGVMKFWIPDLQLINPK